MQRVEPEGQLKHRESMDLEFYGAADGVTGSLHRLRIGDLDVLLDAGLFQGHRAEANRRNREVPHWATRAGAMVLSHAHIDHSGNIPSLVKRGFGGDIFCTPPTRDLCSVMLRDSAMIQQQDARYLNRRFPDQVVEPLYDTDDVARAMSQMIAVPHGRGIGVAPGVRATFFNAGHVLGSALVQLDIEHRGRRVRMLYTGDLGRAELPLLEPPAIPEGVDLLLMESTYGDRDHPDIGSVDAELGQIITDTIGRGGKVFIPTFALERAQEVLFALDRLSDSRALPKVPIYIDSPLAIAITEIYKLHPESLAANVRDRLLGRDDPFSPPGLRYVSDIDASRAIQQSREPCIVIAGSGMCEGGRIVYHLREGLGEPANSVVITGFMAQHTLGRRLVERRPKVKLLGVERDVRTQIHVLNALSAHADATDLVNFAKAVASRGHLRRVALVHGEERSKEALAGALREAGMPKVVTASMGESIPL